MSKRTLQQMNFHKCTFWLNNSSCMDKIEKAQRSNPEEISYNGCDDDD